jgi:hypothetical protein
MLTLANLLQKISGAARGAALPGFARGCTRKPTNAYKCLRFGPPGGVATRGLMFTNVDVC